MRSGLLSFLLLATFCQISLTQSSDYAQELSNSLTKRALVLRHYYTDAGLSFDANGKLISAATEGFGPTDGRIYVQSIELTPDQLVLTGDRPVDFFDPIKKKWVIADMHRPVSVDIQLPANEMARNAVPKLLSTIFMTQAELASIRCTSSQDKGSGEEQPKKSSQDVTPKLPDTATVAKLQPSCVRNGERVYRSLKGIKPPRAKYAPDPEYTDSARNARVGGTTVLSVIVTPNGNTSAIAVARSLGHGLDSKLLPYAFQLDERAVDAVSRWAFEPAHLEDTPVAVLILVEVNFKIK